MTDILISEIHPNPTEGFEWIELYNNSSEGISTSRLNIYDQTSKNLTFSNAFVEPKTYVIATASAILNNGGDTVFLEKDGTIVETLTYGPVLSGKSYARCGNVWIEDVLPTYGYNNVCDEESILPTVTVSAMSSPPASAPTRVPTPEKIMARIPSSTALHPIDFNAKHGNIIMQTTSSALVPTTVMTKAISGTPETSHSLLLLTIGIVSFIQCVFLVYLIIKRIRMDAPLSQHHNEK